MALFSSLKSFAVLSFDVPTYSSNCTVEWLRFIGEHGAQTDDSRRDVFCANLVRISEHNQRAEEFGYSLKIGPFAANTTEEMRLLLGNPHPLNYSDPRVNVSTAGLSFQEALNVDWRSRMGPIKNQGSCGSCWVRRTAVQLTRRPPPQARPPNATDARAPCTGLLGDRRRRL